MLTEAFKTTISFSESNRSMKAELTVSVSRPIEASEKPMSEDGREGIRNILRDDLWESIYGEVQALFYQAEYLALQVSPKSPASVRELEDVFREIRRILEVPC